MDASEQNFGPRGEDVQGDGLGDDLDGLYQQVIRLSRKANSHGLSDVSVALVNAASYIVDAQRSLAERREVFGRQLQEPGQ